LLALPEAAEHSLARGYALHEVGSIACGLGDYETGLAYLEEGKAIGVELGEAGKHLLGWILVDLAELLANQDLTECQQLNEQGIAILQEVGRPWQFWLGFNNRGWYAVRQGDYVQAYAAFRDGLEFAQKNNHVWLSGISFRQLGHLLYLQGDYRSARTYLEESVAILQPIGDLRHQPLDVLGAVALLEGNPQRAIAYFEERLEMHRRLGSKVYFPQDLCDLGIASGHLGDQARAAARFHEALSLIRVAISTFDHTFDLAVCLLCLAGVQPKPHRAAQLLAAAQTIFETNDWVVEPLYQAKIDRIKKAARASLGEEAFAAAHAKGKNMPVDQAIAMALADSDDWVDGNLTSFDGGSIEGTKALVTTPDENGSL